MCKLAVLSILLAADVTTSAGAGSLATPGEAHHYQRYSQHTDVSRFLSELDVLSPALYVRIIGRSQATDVYGARDLYLCILTSEGVVRPSQLNRKKPTILIIASQHGNEQSGKEAALRLVRDLAIGKLRSLLSKLNVLVVPQVNPFGNWVDQRRNEQSLDLNRDHVKLESPQVRALHRVFRAWMPEVTLDVHETRDRYYRVSTGCGSNPNIDASLLAFCRNEILTAIRKGLAARKLTFQEYLVHSEMGDDPLAEPIPKLLPGQKPAKLVRFSTTDVNDGRNSFGIYETLSLIQEGASRHDLTSLRQRCDWQYHGMRLMLQRVAERRSAVTRMVWRLRQNLLDRAKTLSPDDRVILRMVYARDRKQPVLKIKTFGEASRARGVLKAAKKAGDLVTADDLTPPPMSSEKEVLEEVVENWFPNVKPALSVARPLGYLIPAEQREVVETLLHHGLDVETFVASGSLPVQAYTISEIVPAKEDYSAPQRIDVEVRAARVPVRPGDFYVSCAQAGANVVSILLEPQSLYGLIRYQRFALALGRGAAFPLYRIEQGIDVARVPFKRWPMGVQ